MKDSSTVFIIFDELLVACACGDMNKVKWTVENGIDPSCNNYEAIKVARRNGNNNIAEYLERIIKIRKII